MLPALTSTYIRCPKKMEQVLGWCTQNCANRISCPCLRAWGYTGTYIFLCACVSYQLLSVAHLERKRINRLFGFREGCLWHVFLLQLCKGARTTAFAEYMALFSTYVLGLTVPFWLVLLLCFLGCDVWKECYSCGLNIVTKYSLLLESGQNPKLSWDVSRKCAPTDHTRYSANRKAKNRGESPWQHVQWEKVSENNCCCGLTVLHTSVLTTTLERADVARQTSKQLPHAHLQLQNSWG